MTAGVLLRSTLFALMQLFVTPFYTVIALLTFPLPPLTRYRVISSWSRLMIWAAERICGIRYRVRGAENFPRSPCIIVAKHESAWETLAFQVVFPPQVWVVKRELLWVPFFGWGLAMLSPIAIDRREGARALRRLAEQGRARLALGFSIVIFPEGTRSRPGVPGTYHAGAAWLAKQLDTAIVPVAHNAGDVWPRKSFLKYPGLVTLSIGAPVRADGATKPGELMRRIEAWIEGEMKRIRPA